MRTRTSPLAALLLLALPVVGRAVDVSVVSNTDAWSVSETHMDSTGQPVTTELGKPQYVCLDATRVPPVPSSCPTTATPAPLSYGYGFLGWTADLSSLPPGARWIWASQKPDTTPITGATTGAANSEFRFKTAFFLCGNQPRDGRIWAAADNSVQVFVNGAPMPVLSTSSHSAVSSATIPGSSLKTGPNPNVIELVARNAANPADCSNDQYQCNPAGVVFGATFGDELSANPRCANPAGDVGDVRTVGSCAAPLSGARYSACICLGGAAAWFDYDSCKLTCTGYTYSAWSACGANGQQTRTVTGQLPAGCTGAPPSQPVLTQPCTYVPPTCTSFTYSAWAQCQPDGTQTRTVMTSSPAGCVGGTPTTSQSCVYVPPIVMEGQKCGARDRVPPIFATCPAGTSCKPRTIPPPPRPDYCAALIAAAFFTGGLLNPAQFSECNPKALQTVDWFCDR
jgi:hypothetical protein